MSVCRIIIIDTFNILNLWQADVILASSYDIFSTSQAE